MFKVDWEKMNLDQFEADVSFKRFGSESEEI